MNSTDQKEASLAFQRFTDPIANANRQLRAFIESIRRMADQFSESQKRLEELRRKLEEGDEWKGDR